MLGLVGISEAWFSHLAAHIVTGFTCSDPANIPVLIILSSSKLVIHRSTELSEYYTNKNCS